MNALSFSVLIEWNPCVQEKEKSGVVKTVKKICVYIYIYVYIYGQFGAMWCNLVRGKEEGKKPRSGHTLAGGLNLHNGLEPIQFFDGGSDLDHDSVEIKGRV